MVRVVTMVRVDTMVRVVRMVRKPRVVSIKGGCYGRSCQQSQGGHDGQDG